MCSRLRCLTPCVVAMMLAAPVSAHDVIVEHVVEMVVEPMGDHLLVRLHLPLILFGTATTLPPNAIAADIAHNLDLQQADATIPLTATTARVTADRTSLDIALTYATAGLSGFSARLNAFDATAGPVRTNVRYAMMAGRDLTLTVTGPPERVTFAPLAWDVVQQFVARGLRALTDGGDHLLLLLCVLLPVRRARSALAIYLGAALGQTLSIALVLLRHPSMTPESLAAIGMVAVSLVLVATLQNVVRAQIRWVLALAFAFGTLNGVAFGRTLIASTQFAGEASSFAIAAFVLVVLVGELWFGAIAWGTRAWLDERGVPGRAVTLLTSALIAHSAVHRLLDRGHVVALAGSFSAEHAVVWLTLAWACVMLLIALGKAISRRPLPSTSAEAS